MLRIPDNSLLSQTEACEIAAFTPDKRIIYDNKLMTELDIQAQKDYAVKEALAEGKAEGRADEKLDIAKNMLTKGFELSVISELTGLSKDALRSLRDRRIHIRETNTL
jgi:predicted transposase/invertase (TIGR01784 family)